MSAVTAPLRASAAPAGTDLPTIPVDPAVLAADAPAAVRPLPAADEPLPPSCEHGTWYRLLLRGDERLLAALEVDDDHVVADVQRAIRSADAQRLVRDLHALAPYAYASRKVLDTLAARVAEADPRLAHGLIRRGTPLATIE